MGMEMKNEKHRNEVEIKRQKKTIIITYYRKMVEKRHKKVPYICSFILSIVWNRFRVLFFHWAILPFCCNVYLVSVLFIFHLRPYIQKFFLAKNIFPQLDINSCMEVDVVHLGTAGHVPACMQAWLDHLVIGKQVKQTVLVQCTYCKSVQFKPL